MTIKRAPLKVRRNLTISAVNFPWTTGLDNLSHVVVNGKVIPSLSIHRSPISDDTIIHIPTTTMA
jgi:hypothetical protein